MEQRGLCSTCTHDKSCTFPRKFPVWHCEEFSNDESKPMETKKIKNIKQKIE